MGDTVVFKLGREDRVRQVEGTVQAVEGAKYRVLIGTGFNQEFKTVFAGSVIEVRQGNQDHAQVLVGSRDVRQADELGL